MIYCEIHVRVSLSEHIYRFLFVESTLLCFRSAIIEAFVEKRLNKVVFGLLLMTGSGIEGI